MQGGATTGEGVTHPNRSSRTTWTQPARPISHRPGPRPSWEAVRTRPPVQPTDGGPGLAPLCAPAGPIAHDPALRPAGPPGSRTRGPRARPPARHIPPRASLPPLPQLSLGGGGAPGAAGTAHRDKLPGEAGDASGAIRGRFGAAPAPRRVPGRRAADSRPAGGCRSGASGRRPPGQRELGRERGAGSRRARARGRAGARRRSRARERLERLLKGQCPRDCGPTGRGWGAKLQSPKGELDAGSREGFSA